jgi:hypothetical protein
MSMATGLRRFADRERERLETGQDIEDGRRKARPEGADHLRK